MENYLLITYQKVCAYLEKSEFFCWRSKYFQWIFCIIRLFFLLKVLILWNSCQKISKFIINSNIQIRKSSIQKRVKITYLRWWDFVRIHPQLDQILLKTRTSSLIYSPLHRCWSWRCSSHDLLTQLSLSHLLLGEMTGMSWKRW